MPTTIHDVAKRAGVGIGTVSSVMNHSRPVNETTRQKVLTAVAELNYVPNPSARSLSMGKTHTIAVVVPFFTSAAQMERLRGVMSVIAESDYDINLFAVETIPQRDKVLQSIHQGSVDGLLIFSLYSNDSDLERIAQEKIPTVLVESTHPTLPHLFVDDIAAAKTAVNHLIDLGHRRIAYISSYLDDPFGSPFSYNRYLGYCQALQEAGLDVEANYQLQGKHNRESGRTMAHHLLTQADRPTAVFTFSDELALSVLETARDLQIAIPQELSVVGYDDIELAHFAQLTTIRQHLFASGQQAVSWLLELIGTTPNPANTSRAMTPELIIRQTTAPPKSI